MANPGGFGLRPLGTRGSHTDSGAQWKYFIDPTDISPIYYGEPVIAMADASTGQTTGYIKSLRSAVNGGNAKLTAYSPMLGVFLGCRYISNNSVQAQDYANPARIFWPGSAIASVPSGTQVIALVSVDPNQRYLAAIGSSTPTTGSTILNCLNYANMAFGSEANQSECNNGGYSTAAIDGNTITGFSGTSTTGSVQLFIDGLATPDSTASLTTTPAGTQYVVYLNNIVAFKYNQLTASNAA